MDTESAADCNHSECLPTAVEIDPRGDLTLLVGLTVCRSPSNEYWEERQMPPKAVAFRVCSRAVARAARVFAVMLYGNFAEARQPESDWTVRLPDDDPEAMAKLLPVIHGRVDNFDSSPGFSRPSILYNIAVITDKYDLTHILRPWANKIVKLLGPWTRLFPLDSRPLWVSWVFGSSVTFKSVMERLAWDTAGSGPYMVHEPSGVCGEHLIA